MSVNEEYIATMSPSDRAGLVSLTPSECIAAYTAPFQASHSDVLVVATGKSWNERSGNKTETQFYAVNMPGLCDKKLSYQWMCDGQFPIMSCTTCDGFLDWLVSDNITNWQPFGFPVEYCLSQPVEEMCSLKFSQAIWWTVVALNLVKIVLMGFVARHERAFQPLLTVGDAVASFMQRSDGNTAGMCLLSKRDIITKRKGEKITSSRSFEGVVRRKFAGASKARWAVCVLL
jgi:hypothetical protein